MAVHGAIYSMLKLLFYSLTYSWSDQSHRERLVHHCVRYHALVWIEITSWLLQQPDKKGATPYIALNYSSLIQN